MTTNNPATNLSLFDAHCHLQDDRIYGDLPSIMDRAEKAGVSGFLCNGRDVVTWLPGP